jgi:hypothetical protein
LRYKGFQRHATTKQRTAGRRVRTWRHPTAEPWRGAGDLLVWRCGSASRSSPLQNECWAVLRLRCTAFEWRATRPPIAGSQTLSMNSRHPGSSASSSASHESPSLVAQQLGQLVVHAGILRNPGDKRFFRKLLTKQCRVPRVLVTDKLRCYQAAHRAVMPSVEHRQSRYLNSTGRRTRTRRPGNANAP